jgi:hypothetical protein
MIYSRIPRANINAFGSSGCRYRSYHIFSFPSSRRGRVYGHSDAGIAGVEGATIMPQVQVTVKIRLPPPLRCSALGDDHFSASGRSQGCRVPRTNARIVCTLQPHQPAHPRAGEVANGASRRADAEKAPVWPVRIPPGGG